MAQFSSEAEVVRRLKFRDLQVFFSVVDTGSMAEAGRQLGLSQPAVSEVIAQLERLFGARLFDRNTRGAESTIYGRALLKRAQAAFDEMKQGVRDVEFLTDPTSGEVRIGCAQRLSAAILSQIAHQFFRAYPRVVLHIDEVPPLTRELSGLRDRKYDLVLGRLVTPLVPDCFGDDVNVEMLFDDRLVVGTGTHARWARRRQIDLAELIDEHWILTAPGTSSYSGVAEAFRLRGLAMPKISLVTASVHVTTDLLANGPFVTAISKVLAERLGLKVLPIELPVASWPAVIITLKNRTLSPVAERFIEFARESTKSIAGTPRSRGS